MTGTAAIYCLKRILCNVFSGAMYSSGQLQACTSVINILSTLRTDPELCKNVSLAVSFGSNRNSYTISTQSGMRPYSLQYRDSSRAKEIQKQSTAVNAAYQGNLFACRGFASPGLHNSR